MHLGLTFPWGLQVIVLGFSSANYRAGSILSIFRIKPRAIRLLLEQAVHHGRQAANVSTRETGPCQPIVLAGGRMLWNWLHSFSVEASTVRHTDDVFHNSGVHK